MRFFICIQLLFEYNHNILAGQTWYNSLYNVYIHMGLQYIEYTKYTHTHTFLHVYLHFV